MTKISGNQGTSIPISNLRISIKAEESEEAQKHKEPVVLPDRHGWLISLASSTDDTFPLPGIDEENGLKKLEIAEHEIAGSVASLEWGDSRLVCRIHHTSEHHEIFQKLMSGEFDRKSLIGRLGEYDVQAHDLLRINQSGRIVITNHETKEGQKYETLDVSGMHWIVASNQRKPVCWIGVLEEEISFNKGPNLRMVRKADGMPLGLGIFLQGIYDYCLILRRKILIIIPPDGHEELDVQKLAQDQVALSFVLGQRVSITRIVGIDRNGVPCAERESLKYHYQTEVGYRMTPVPTIELDGKSAFDRRAWYALFFAKCSKALREQPTDRIDMALATYVDSLSGDVIPAYLRLQVQIEALAYHLLQARWPEQAKTKLVTSMSKWKKFVAEEIKPRLAEFARDTTAASDLFTKIDSVPKHVSGNRVRDIFKQFSIELSQSTLDEINERDTIVHQMEISKERDGRIVVERELSRIKQMQTLLVALIALAVGYRGKIRQWERPLGRPLANESTTIDSSSRWWDVDSSQDEEATNFYVALIE